MLRWLTIIVVVALGFAMLDARDESDGASWGALRRFQGASIRSGDGKGIHVKRNVKSNFHLCKKAFQKSKVSLAVRLGTGSATGDDAGASGDDGDDDAGTDEDSRVEHHRGYAD